MDNINSPLPSLAVAALDPSVDLDRLLDITNGSPEMLQEIVQLFFNQADELMAQLQTALHNGSAPEVKDITHKLAGMSFTCGLQGIAVPIQELEVQSSQGNLDGGSALFQQTFIEVERVRGLFKDFLQIE